MSTALAHRTLSVLRGDTDTIRVTAADPRATDQSLPLVFFAVLAASVRAGASDPVSWMLRSFLVAAMALVAYAAALWLIGMAFEGTGRFISLFRVAGFTAVPLALGLIPGIGLLVGAVWSFVLAARVLRALHVVETQVAVVTAVLPSMLMVTFVLALVVPGA